MGSNPIQPPATACWTVWVSDTEAAPRWKLARFPFLGARDARKPRACLSARASPRAWTQPAGWAGGAREFAAAPGHGQPQGGRLCRAEDAGGLQPSAPKADIGVTEERTSPKNRSATGPVVGLSGFLNDRGIARAKKSHFSGLPLLRVWSRILPSSMSVPNLGATQCCNGELNVPHVNPECGHMLKQAPCLSAQNPH